MEVRIMAASKRSTRPNLGGPEDRLNIRSPEQFRQFLFCMIASDLDTGRCESLQRFASIASHDGNVYSLTSASIMRISKAISEIYESLGDSNMYRTKGEE